MDNHDIISKYRKVVKEKKTVLKNSTPYGLDIGTMNLVSAHRSDSSKADVEIEMMRNMYIKVDKDALGSFDLNNISSIEVGDELFILSDDALNLANIFNTKVNRPMSKGLISAADIDSAKILGIMINDLIGNSKDSVCCYSVPANPVDAEMNTIYHASVFERIISQFGFKAIPLQEGIAVVYSECAEEDFTGLGISCGAGMVNVGLAYKSVPVMSFSVARSGDWIDENAGSSVGKLANRMTTIKERADFNLLQIEASKPSEQAAREALIYYYRSMINYVLKHIIKELSKVTTDLPDSIPIIVSGGTSKAEGFVTMFSNELEKVELPFEVSSVRAAKDPMTAVAEGCLIRAIRG